MARPVSSDRPPRARSLLLAFLLALAGCPTIEHAGGEIGGAAAEFVVCPTGLINCGHVLECEAPADNPLGHVEICLDDDEDLAKLESLYGDCAPTPRHQGLCRWCCGDSCGKGCNAYSGCFCP